MQPCLRDGALHGERQVSGCISREAQLGSVTAQITLHLGGMGPLGYVGLKWQLGLLHPVSLKSALPLPCISLNHLSATLIKATVLQKIQGSERAIPKITTHFPVVGGLS